MASIVRIGRTTDEACLLQGSNDLSHGLRLHAFRPRKAGNSGCAILFKANKYSNLRRCQIFATSLFANAQLEGAMYRPNLNCKRAGQPGL